jgi:UDP-glucose 4-epimerase
MKCVLLGGAGFIGSHLAATLLSAGHAVRVFDRPQRETEHETERDRAQQFSWRADVEWVEGDFVNPMDTERALADQEIVYHLVSTTLPKTSNDNPLYDIESNLGGSLNMLQLAVRHDIRKVIFISSGGTVYGMPRQIPISETHPTDPLCSYGIVKLAVEKYLHLFHAQHGLGYCVLRLANPFGERQRIASAQGAVTTFLQRALKEQPIEIWGDGSVVRDYIYVGDAVEAMAAAIDARSDAQVINVGSGAGQSLNDILGAIEKLLGRTVARRYAAARQFDVPVNILDISRARSLLGWHPRVAFAEGLARTAQWLSRHV